MDVFLSFRVFHRPAFSIANYCIAEIQTGARRRNHPLSRPAFDRTICPLANSIFCSFANCRSQSGKVIITGPSAVIATVCSKWADNAAVRCHSRPTVRTVLLPCDCLRSPSARWRSSFPVTGAHLFRVCRNWVRLGSSCSFAPTPWPTKSRTTE